MRTSSTSDRKISTAHHASSPSVPLSVYRELATELQAKEAMLQSVHTQNQHLVQQNQQLRQEIEKAVESVLQLQQVVDSPRGVSWNYTQVYKQEGVFEANHPGAQPHRSPSVKQNVVASPFPMPGKESNSRLTEQNETPTRRRSHTENESPANGWLLAIAILLIIVTAFSAGYFMVRPLLQNRSTAISVER